MKVTTMQPVEGAAPEQDVEVSEDRGAWLIANGYATKAGGNPPDFDGIRTTTVDREADPTTPAEPAAEPTAKTEKRAERPKR